MVKSLFPFKFFVFCIPLYFQFFPQLTQQCFARGPHGRHARMPVSQALRNAGDNTSTLLIRKMLQRLLVMHQNGDIATRISVILEVCKFHSSFTRSSIPLFYVHSFIHSFSHSFIHSFSHSFIQALKHGSIYSIRHSFIYFIIYFFHRSFISSF